MGADNGRFGPAAPRCGRLGDRSGEAGSEEGARRCLEFAPQTWVRQGMAKSGRCRWVRVGAPWREPPGPDLSDAARAEPTVGSWCERTSVHGTRAPLAREHVEIRRLVEHLGEFVEHPEAHADRGAVLAIRRVLLRLYVLLKTHLAEEELYVPILEDRLTRPEEAALSRALDHTAAVHL